MPARRSQRRIIALLMFTIALLGLTIAGCGSSKSSTSKPSSAVRSRPAGPSPSQPTALPPGRRVHVARFAADHGNIGCQMSPVFVRCAVGKLTWATNAPKCTAGQAVGISLGANSLPKIGCVPASLLAGKPPALAAGPQDVAGPLFCSVNLTIVSCGSTATSFEFELSRSTYALTR